MVDAALPKSDRIIDDDEFEREVSRAVKKLHSNQEKTEPKPAPKSSRTSKKPARKSGRKKAETNPEDEITITFQRSEWEQLRDFRSSKSDTSALVSKWIRDSLKKKKRNTVSVTGSDMTWGAFLNELFESGVLIDLCYELNLQISQQVNRQKGK